MNSLQFFSRPFAKTALLPATLLSLALAFPLLTGQLQAEPVAAKCTIINENVILEKSQVKMQEICNEVSQKTGVAMHIAAIEKLKDFPDILAYEKDLAKNDKGSFVVMALVSGDKKVDVHLSEDLKTKVDRDDVLDHYIIPILAERRKDVKAENQFSAALFNGLTSLSYQLSKSFHVEIASLPPEDQGGAGLSQGWTRYLPALPFLALILVTIYYYWKHRWRKKA